MSKTESKITIRMKKNIFLSLKTFKVSINTKEIGLINYKQDRIECNLGEGRHLLNISNKSSFKQIELLFPYDQNRVITIYPNITYEFFIATLAGISFISTVVHFLILKKLVTPLILIPFIPLLLIKKRNFIDSFELTEQ